MELLFEVTLGWPVAGVLGRLFTGLKPVLSAVLQRVDGVTPSAGLAEAKVRWWSGEAADWADHEQVLRAIKNCADLDIPPVEVRWASERLTYFETNIASTVETLELCAFR